MAYRLALDVGTASCGLVVWELDENGQPSRLAWNSLDIWPEPLLPAKSGGVGQPKKAARRSARQMRRGVYRRARRLRKIAHLAGLLGLYAADIPSDNGQHIHKLRAQAAEDRIDLADLLPVLLHLAKHRGPSGDWVYAEPDANRPEPKRVKVKGGVASADGVGTSQVDEPVKQTEEERKGIVAGVRKLESLMDEAAKQLLMEGITLGQYLYYRRQQGETVILGKGGLYPSRRMVKDEFDCIWNKQSEYHSVLENPEVRKQFFDAIFYQRPLKSPAPMVGHCPLEPTLPRSPAAQMVAQAFRIEKQIADLRWGIGRRAQPLSKEQKAVLREMLDDTGVLTQKGDLSFKKVLAAFEVRGCPGPQGCGLNMDRSNRENLKGNTTLAAFKKLGLEDEWRALDEITQVQVINFLADLGSPDALDDDSWHTNFETAQKDPVTGHKKKRQFSLALVDFVNLLRKHPQCGRLSGMGFDGGRMGYSIKALNKLVVLMREGWDERAAIEQAYPDRFAEKAIERELPLPDATGNTVVDVALRQVYCAVRRAMNEMDGPPEQVIVELSRDMALGVKKRGEIEKKIGRNQKARNDARKALKAENQQATERNIQRYLLWESQLHYCPYCADRISLGEALSSVTEREHILPRTLTRVGGKRSQLVLSHKKCNNEKGDHTPWQAFGGDEKRWQIIEDHAAILANNRQHGKAKLLLLKDWEDEVLDNEAIKGFTDRQFHEGSWIAKLTAQWLRSVCADVSVSRGALTAHLRRIWKLETVIPEVRLVSGLPALDRDGKPISPEEFERYKSWWEGHNEAAGGVPTERRLDKRIDHRHHLVDALVISLTDRKLFAKMAENYKHEREKERHGERAKLSLYEAPPIPHLRDVAMQTIANAQIRHKPDRHPDGPMFEQTAYGLSRRPGDKGEYKLAVSKPLIALIDNKGNVEKTRRALEDIESDATRNAVLQAFDRRIAAGANLKQIFDEPILHPQFGTPIRRVRLLSDSADTAAVVTHTNRYGKQLEKRYPHAGNAYLEILVKDGKLIGKPRLVTIQEAMLGRGMPVGESVTRFWKGDTVLDRRDGRSFVIRQIKAEGGGSLIGTLVTETRPVRELTAADGRRKFSGRAMCRLEFL